MESMPYGIGRKRSDRARARSAIFPKRGCHSPTAMDNGEVAARQRDFPGQMAENSVSSEYLEKRMLFKKTLKVVSATALWMVALLGATSAMAQDVVLPTFSAEALPAAAMTADGPGVNAPDADGMPATVPINSRAAFYLAESVKAAAPLHLRVSSTGVLALARAPTVQIGTQAPTDTRHPRSRTPMWARASQSRTASATATHFPPSPTP